MRAAMVTKWDLIYELRADEDRVRRVQEETAQGDGFATAPDVFGTKKWWAAIKAGLIEGSILDANGVENQLATMPGKNELRAMLLATLQAPLQNFVALLAAPAQNLVYLLAAKERQE